MSYKAVFHLDQNEVAPKSRTNIVIFKVCSLAFSYAAIAAASSPQ